MHLITDNNQLKIPPVSTGTAATGYEEGRHSDEEKKTEKLEQDKRIVRSVTEKNISL